VLPGFLAIMARAGGPGEALAGGVPPPASMAYCAAFSITAATSAGWDM